MLLKYRCAVNHVGYYGEEWNLDLVNAHGKREINDGPETKSFLCWMENDKAKCVQENREETGDSSAHVLKQDHCQKWPGENRVCSAYSFRSQSSSRKSKEKLKLGGKVRVGIGRNWHSIERRVLFAGFPSLCCSACCFISSKIPCPGLTLSTVS